jgi:ribosomal protein S18 acetylase RimI-like enzyme
LQIDYRSQPELTTEEFIDILNRSTLAERRPIKDLECIEGMLKNADIIITAIHNDKIIGIARSVTDLMYCCYLSDLAVDQQYQKQGIGKRLIEKTQELLGKKCKIILLSAPKATEYYPKIGFTKHTSAWTLDKDEKII